MEMDRSMHDGSKKGNAPMSAVLYGDLAVCPEKDCPSLGAQFKCYKPCYTECNTYIERNDREASEIDSELVEMVD